MENTGKLIILLTSSVHDRGQLQNKANWPKSCIAYLDCDQGGNCSDRPLETPRLLSVVLESKDSNGATDMDGNTKDVMAVLAVCKRLLPVIGTHTGQNPPSTVLNLSALPSSVAVTAYTTASEIYHFIYPWCQELAKNTPDVQKVQEGFDKLFAVLKGERPAAQVANQSAGQICKWSKIKHDLTNLLDPIAIDFGGWAKCGFNDGYFDVVPLQPFPIEHVQHIIYSSGSQAPETIENTITKYLKSNLSSQARSQLEASWKTLQELVPRLGQANPSFDAVAQVLSKVQTPIGRNELKVQLKVDNKVVQWISAIKAQLDLLSRIIKTQGQ